MSTAPSLLRPCVVMMVIATAITGIAYPLFVTGVAHVAFPDAAAGSLIRRGDIVIGSRLIAQPFAGAEWFWPRPSATAWNAAASGASNLAPVTAPQHQAWAAQAAALRSAGIAGTLPADLVTASGSGLDPHLSPAAVLVQVPRVAAARGLEPQDLRQLVAEHTESPQLGVLGPERVNVLELNLAIERMAGGGR